ncbi:alpha/beta fold hydrolase [Georgenia sp. SUBG003]|uniref:alpha/beta fold hydrolase n=1 Tax=Georgenia sp. SUBG003 TaxID=1497974 RepID=UPI0004D6892A|nr:alpha/beta hydrolase [Georgenia sp. SUBG003]
MTTFAVVHGAGGSAWEWHLVRDELTARGHATVAVDLPSEDESADLWAYAETVVAAVRAAQAEDVVVVAHSLGGFVAPLVAARIPVRRLVLVSAMVPAPGETAGEWWDTSGYREATADARPDADEMALFLHDVDPELAAEALRRSRDQADRMMADPWPLAAWPDVPTSFLVPRDDRVFPSSFLRTHARERLGVTADEMPGSHCVYLSRPAELADRLVAYAELGPPARR